MTTNGTFSENEGLFEVFEAVIGVVTQRFSFFN